MQLDATDVKKLAEFMDTLERTSGINIRAITFDVYGEHRVRASRRGRWGKLGIRKIEEIPQR